jgi:hypothetical protein
MTKDKSRRPKRSAPGLFDVGPETIRQKEIRREMDRPIFLWWLGFKAANETDRALLAKAKRVYERVLFGRSDGESRAVSEFLWQWQTAKLYQYESTQLEPTAQMPMEMASELLFLLAPLVDALNSSDAKFFEALAKAMRCTRSEREKLKKRLIEIDELIHPTGRILSWQEIWKTYCPEHKDTPQNFQKLLKECGIQFGPAGEFRRKKLERVQKHKKNTRSERCIA